MTATTTNNAANNTNTTASKAEYFNLNIKGLGYLATFAELKP